MGPIRGFGLVELMVALTIALLMALAIGEIYVVMRRGEHTITHLSQLQESARFIADRIKRDVRMAGYYGGTYQRWNVRQTSVGTFQLPVSAATECFQASDANVSFRWAVPITTVGAGDVPPKIYGSDTVAPFTNCLSGALDAGSDILAVHYAAPTALAAAGLTGKKYYIQSSILSIFGFYCGEGKSGNGCLPADTPPAITGTEYYELTSRVYYVRSYARTEGDGISTLMVSWLADGSVQREPLVEGVSVFQVSYGTDESGDGVVDRYQDATTLGNLSAANVARWNRVKTVSVTFVLRSLEPDRARLEASPDPVVYTVDGTNYSVDGRYLSRRYQVTAALRNPSDRAGGV